MKTIIRGSLILLAALLCFIAGTLVAGRSHWFQPIATVTILNNTKGEIRSLRFSHSSGRIKSVADLEPPLPGRETKISFFVASEGGYLVEATLANGKVLKTGGGYVESGYQLREVITENAIAQDAYVLGAL